MSRDVVILEPRGNELILRYKQNYGIPRSAVITEEMVLRHWELEKQLTKELVKSNPENRWETFERCYTTLYEQCDWLNNLVGSADSTPPSISYAYWVRAIGPPPKKVYEIGSGNARMIEYLASLGYYCKGTEITRKRGAILLKSTRPNLEWGISDGIRLDEFEKPESFDVVLSKEVIEHLHPDDVHDHFRGACSILKPRGRYIFCTPHKSAGPQDVSRVFKYDRPVGMHLREYTYRELTEIIRGSGFNTLYALVGVPGAGLISAFARGAILQKTPLLPSKTYLNYLCSVERVILGLPRQSWQRSACWLLGTTLLFAPNMFMIAQK